MKAADSLTIRLLGELEVSVGGSTLALPQSKKTRALLAYLVITGRSHRRERLCSLLWDVTDDPRGALRWSLSKLRPFANAGAVTRIVADRESVTFSPEQTDIDWTHVQKRAANLEHLDDDALEELAGQFRGELLEGLELPEFHEFQAWCLAEREQARRIHVKLLQALVERRKNEPERALPHAQRLVQVDALDAGARAQLIELLCRLDRCDEAEQQYQTGKRLFRELGSEEPAVLQQAWQALQQKRRKVGGAIESPPSSRLMSERMPSSRLPADRAPLCGRGEVLGMLRESLERCRDSCQQEVVLLQGEPGVGKSRLLAELEREAGAGGWVALHGRAYEAELGRPYGPWIDALQRLSRSFRQRNELSVLIAELTNGRTDESSRERLFATVAELLSKLVAGGRRPVLLILDDVHWCDEGSAALLHYCVRTGRRRPLFVALAARDGELPDNTAMARALRALKRDAGLRALPLERLSEDAIRALVRSMPTDLDAARVYAESGGNPLFALELTRSSPEREPGQLSLHDVVADRVERLPQEAADVVRWGAVLGSVFSTAQLEALVAIELEELAYALELLERHALLVPDGNDYAFAHDVVRSVVYADMSTPRRRLMHRRVAQQLEPKAQTDPNVAGALAHHAALAGNSALAAQACVWAGQRCLRVFAHQQAETLARRGLRYTEDLEEQAQVTLRIDLLSVECGARKPDDPQAMIDTLDDLAQRAMDLGAAEHARRAFFMISTIRWERGDWTAARDISKRAERLSRSGTDEERLIALADSGRCLALLERDLADAEAQLLEAQALAERIGLEPSTLVEGIALLRLHQGDLDEAEQRLQRSRLLAQREGQRLIEHLALEQEVLLAIQQLQFARAKELVVELGELAQKLRPGSEAPAARALAALCDYALGDLEARQPLDAEVEQLRIVDAKHRLAAVQLRAAMVELERGELDQPRARAEEALRCAEILERATETGLARWVLARVAQLAQDSAQFEEHAAALGETAQHASAEVRVLASRLSAQAR